MLLGSALIADNASAQEPPAPLPPPNAPAAEPLPPATPQPAPVPPAPPAPRAKEPSAGHIWTPAVKPRAAAPAPASAEQTPDANAAPAAPAAPVEDPEPTTGPVRGFTMEARLAQSLGEGGVSRGALGTTMGAPPIASLGYRANDFAVLFGPSFSHLGSENGVSSTSIGLEVHFEITVVATDDRVNEGYLLLGGSLGGTTYDAPEVNGGLAATLAVGFGARHWVSRHLAIGAEIGEGYLNVPSVDVTTSASGRTTSTTSRLNAFDTFGALGVTVVF